MPSGCISLVYFPSRDKGVFGVLLWAVRILLRRRSSTISSSVISLVVEFYQDISVNIIKMLCSSSDHYLLLGNGHQIGLELIQIKIESSVKSQRGCDGGHNLTNQPVEVGAGWPLNARITAKKYLRIDDDRRGVCRPQK